MKHDIIAEAGEFIVGLASFQINFHSADLRQALGQCGEKIRRNNQLAFLLNALLHTVPEGITTQGIGPLYSCTEV